MGEDRLADPAAAAAAAEVAVLAEAEAAVAALMRSPDLPVYSTQFVSVGRGKGC